MSREATTGRGGVFSHFGPRTTDEKRGGVHDAGGRKKQVVYKFSYDDLPRGSTDLANVEIPIGAVITDAYWKTTTVFAGGTGYDVGLESSAQAAIDADGLWDAIVLTEIDATPGAALISASVHTGTNSGVLIGQHLTVAAQLMVVANGTFTAGEATVTIEYIV